MQAEENMKKYGKMLIENAPDESTQFLKSLCTNYRPTNKPLVDQSALNGTYDNHVDRANPEDYIHLFLNNSERLVEFLEHLIKCDSKWVSTSFNIVIYQRFYYF